MGRVQRALLVLARRQEKQTPSLVKVPDEAVAVNRETLRGAVRSVAQRLTQQCCVLAGHQGRPRRERARAYVRRGTSGGVSRRCRRGRGRRPRRGLLQSFTFIHGVLELFAQARDGVEGKRRDVWWREKHI